MARKGTRQFCLPARTGKAASLHALLAALTLAVWMSSSVNAKEVSPTIPASIEDLDAIFDGYRKSEHVPGLIYGIVAGGRLVHWRSFGVSDLEKRRPIDANTVFRIASMTKVFTALAVLDLRDKGKLSLDRHAEDYVPEMRGWAYPTADSPRIRVTDLMRHTAGFVTDDPWGDRQQVLAEEDFSRIVAQGMTFNRPPQAAYEYSNYGYALLGRIIGNVTQSSYRAYIEQTILQPLQMTSSGFEIFDVSSERLAHGYRWENDAWVSEPMMRHGVFGAMGGLHTTAHDYARFLSYLLSAWPPRDDKDIGPLKRSTLRELAQGQNFVELEERAPGLAKAGCARSNAYGAGMVVSTDCHLGTSLNHGGGYPGYGSFVVLLPDRGVAVFAFTNRTYAAPIAPVWEATTLVKAALDASGTNTTPSVASAELAADYRVAGQIYESGDLQAAMDRITTNFLMDRTRENWQRKLARLREDVGRCDTKSPIKPNGRLSGTFVWTCERGRIEGELLLAPLSPTRIQGLALEMVKN